MFKFSNYHYWAYLLSHYLFCDLPRYYARFFSPRAACREASQSITLIPLFLFRKTTWLKSCFVFVEWYSFCYPFSSQYRSLYCFYKTVSKIAQFLTTFHWISVSFGLTGWLVDFNEYLTSISCTTRWVPLRAGLSDPLMYLISGDLHGRKRFRRRYSRRRLSRWRIGQRGLSRRTHPPIIAKHFNIGITYQLCVPAKTRYVKYNWICSYCIRFKL